MRNESRAPCGVGRRPNVAAPGSGISGLETEELGGIVHDGEGEDPFVVDEFRLHFECEPRVRFEIVGGLDRVAGSRGGPTEFYRVAHDAKGEVEGEMIGDFDGEGFRDGLPGGIGDGGGHLMDTDGECAGFEIEFSSLTEFIDGVRAPLDLIQYTVLGVIGRGGETDGIGRGEPGGERGVVDTEDRRLVGDQNPGGNNGVGGMEAVGGDKAHPMDAGAMEVPWFKHEPGLGKVEGDG